MATNIDHQHAREHANALLAAASRLLTLIEETTPPNPLQFSIGIQHIDAIQRHLNGIRTPIQHLSQQANVNWATDNRYTNTSASGLSAFIFGLCVGIGIALVLRLAC